MQPQLHHGLLDVPVPPVDLRGATGPGWRAVRRQVAAAAVAGLILRLAFAFLYWTGQPLTRDEQEYLSLARSLAAGHGFVYDDALLATGVQPFGRAPGYPAFLAMVGGGAAVTTSVPGPVRIAQSVVGALGVVLVSALAFDLAGARAAIVAARVAAFYPPLVWIAGYVFSEALFWPIALAAAWLLNRQLGEHGGRGWLAATAGVVAAAALLIRPVVAPFLAFAAIWLVGRRAWREATAFTIAALVVLTPWAVRTSLVHGRFVPVASEGGVTFWTGNNAEARGEGDLAANPSLKSAQQALRAHHPALSEEEMEPVYYREAFRWIRENPGDWMALEMRKLYYTFVPVGPSYMLHSRRYVVASLVSYGLLLPLGLAGAFTVRRALGRTPGLWLLVAASVLMSLAFFPQERFRVPVLDPALIVCAAALAARQPERREAA